MWSLYPRNGCALLSPANLLRPTTSPRSFSQLTWPIVAPRLPRSVSRPSCQRNGSIVGMPVVSFGVELVSDQPAICPLRFGRRTAGRTVPRLPGLASRRVRPRTRLRSTSKTATSRFGRLTLQHSMGTS
jgi:hypothetical protein